MVLSIVHRASFLLVSIYFLQALMPSTAQQTCPIGGSTRYCGRSGSNISGNFSTPCTCNPNFCCSSAGYCGPEPTVPGTGTRADYCGSGCQSAYGNCNPGPSYFQYIGTGRTCSQADRSASCPVPDTVNSQVSQIPLPKGGAPLYFIVFALSDQIASPGAGVSTGNFQPFGLYALGTRTNTYLDAAGLQSLKNAGSNVKVMASIAGDTQVTRWLGVSNVDSYVQTATASLLKTYNDFKLAGFDINYEESVNGAQQDQWISAWCQIVSNLKRAGALITFAPYKQTISVYQKLQTCLSQQRNTNIDFVIYQTYSEASADTNTLTTALKSLQSGFAPTKIIAGVGNAQLSSNPNLISQVIQPLLSQGVITGAAVFDADTSSAQSPKFGLERALWST